MDPEMVAALPVAGEHAHDAHLEVPVDVVHGDDRSERRAPESGLTPLCNDRSMDTPNKDSMRWHPASGHSRAAGRADRGDVIDLATKRAVRLLAAAGMIAPAAAARRRRNVR
jgi:hypothetical protein